jgi:hypothetical protein
MHVSYLEIYNDNGYDFLDPYGVYMVQALEQPRLTCLTHVEFI